MGRNIFTDLYIDNIINIHRLLIPTHEPRYFRNRLFCALSFKLEGASIYKDNFRSYTSDPHHVVFMPKGSTYSVESKLPGEFIRIEFESKPNYVDKCIKNYFFKNNNIIRNLLISVEKEWTFKKYAYKKKCLSLLYEILALLEQNEMLSYIDEDKLNIIKPSIEYLENNYYDPQINVTILAKQSRVSISYFRKLFSLIYGMSPSKYLQVIRINKAKDLLANGLHSIGEIAEIVGYSNIYYFSNAFKKATGISPSKFTRQYLT